MTIHLMRAERAMRALGIDLDPRGIERAVGASDRGRVAALHAGRGLRELGNAANGCTCPDPARLAINIFENLDYWPPPSEWT